MSLCTFPRAQDHYFGEVLFLSLMFSRAGLFWNDQVFLDVACINQKDAEMKGEGLLSMGAFLKLGL